MSIKKYIHNSTIFFLTIFFSCVFYARAETPPNSIGSNREVVRATSNLGDKTLQQLVADFVKVATGYVLQILLALTIMMFLYGLMKFMFKGQGSDTARTEGRNLMLWGIIGIFVITAIWSLVAIFATFVGHDSIVIPQFK